MKFAVTQRQRWHLAQLFLHQGLKTSGGVEEIKRFNRTRLALRLGPIMNVLADGKPAPLAIVRSDVAHAYELDEAAVDFLLGKVAVLEMPGYTAAVLGEFWEAVETAKLTKVAPEVGDDVPAYDPAERWAASEDEIREAQEEAARVRQGATAGN